MTARELGAYATIEAGDSGPVKMLLSAPAAPTVTSNGTNLVLTWSAVSGALSYDVYRGTVSGGETLLASGIGSTTYTDVTASPNVTYYYKLAAVDKTGPGPMSPESSGAILPPAAPTGTAATSDGTNLVITWNATPATNSYKVWRGTSPGGESMIGTTINPSYTDTSASPNVLYYYYIVASNAAGDGSPSAEFTGEILPPAQPTGLVLTASTSSIGLTWNADAVTNSYKVYRGTTSGGETLLASNVATPSYTDSTAVGGTVYYYKVSAVNVAGESPLSAEVSGQIIAFPAWNLDGDQSTAFMSAYSNFVSGKSQSNAAVTVGVGGVKVYLGAVNANGFVYVLPYNSGDVKVIDPSTNVLNTTLTLAGSNYGGGVLADNGNIYVVPFGSLKVGVINTSTNAVSTFAATGSYQGCVMALDGFIFCCPQGSGHVGIIDPSADTIDETSIALTGTYIGGVLAPNGKIYMFPSNTGHVAIVDTVALSVDTSTIALSGNWYGGVLASNGKIYCVPNGAGKVAIIDPTTNTVDTTTLSLAGNWSGGIAGADGKLYFTPAGGGKLAIIDPVANTIDTTYSTPGSAYLGGCLGPSGQLYLACNSSSAIAVLRTTIACPTDMVQSRYLNKF
ncbi:MAG: hypothetical protein KGL39_35390 [Patescibacteria group bacterium]|nr:hypothetical protein [Patescibacteria group bacterium]